LVAVLRELPLIERKWQLRRLIRPSHRTWYVKLMRKALWPSERTASILRPALGLAEN
jgi:hypothetical protein